MKTDTDTGDELRIFVYGTLKKGFSNHESYCRGALRIMPARIRGRLFKLSPSIPVMIIPARDILAPGSTDLAEDMQLLAAFSTNANEECVALPGAGPEIGKRSGPIDEWKTINGELLFFDDPETRLPLIDELEEFLPEGPSTYLRVLVRVLLADGSSTTAWTYIASFDTKGLEHYNGETWFPDE